MKRIITAVFVIAVMFILCVKASASSAENGLDRLKDQIDTELSRAIDEDTANDMDVLGATPSDYAKLDM